MQISFVLAIHIAYFPIGLCLLIFSIMTMESNHDRQVIEYLSKKGYSRTEAMLRLESASQDVEGKAIPTRVEETGGLKYGKAFGRYLHMRYYSFAECIRRTYARLDRG